MNCVTPALDYGDLAVDKSIESASFYDETVFHNPEIVAGERILLHEERPNIGKRVVEGRRALITRRVVSTRKTIEVDLLHEELQIEYVGGSGQEMLGREPETIVVRLHAQEVEIVKHVRVVEEVVLSKRRIVETVPVAVELKHEELTVVENAEITPGGGNSTYL